MANYLTGDQRAHYKRVREAALARGETTYEGHPCKNEHSGLRYTKGKGSCVSCQGGWRGRRGRPIDKKRQLAKERGLTTFEGKPCSKGHAGRRYTVSGTCVTCTKKAASERQKRIGHTERQKEQIAAWRVKNYNMVMWNSARNRAINGGLDFAIEPEDIVIPTHCPVLGVPITIGSKVDKNNSPSLDRIDNSKGYVKGNIAVISWRANSLKNNGTIQELQAVLDYMRRHQDLAKPSLLLAA